MARRNEGLKISLAGAQDKLTQITRLLGTAADLGFPVHPALMNAQQAG